MIAQSAKNSSRIDQSIRSLYEKQRKMPHRKKTLRLYATPQKGAKQPPHTNSDREDMHGGVSAQAPGPRLRVASLQLQVAVGDCEA